MLVDDGSTDKTIEVASKFDAVEILSYGANKGKGAAVRHGMLNAAGNYCVFTDTDLSTPIYELEKMLFELEKGYDIVIGNRADNNFMLKVRQPFYREFMGKIFNKIVQATVFKGITDTQCGFKGFKKEAAKAIFSKAQIDGFSFDVEALFLARKLGFTIREIPVEWYNDARSKVNPIKDSTKMMLELFKIRNLYR